VNDVFKRQIEKASWGGKM